MAAQNVSPHASKINRFQEAAVWASGKFTVDTQGRVWRGGRRAENKAGEYLQVKVMIAKIRYYTCAHRLVWHAVKGPIPDGLVVNHKNGVKDDNRPENLEVVSYSQNTKHAHATGLIDQYGERNPACKVNDAIVARIRQMYACGGYTMEQVGATFGVSFQYVSRVVRGNRRAKQPGPMQNHDLRHNASQRDDVTGRFKPVHDGFPVVE